MTALLGRAESEPRASGVRSHAVPLLQVFAVTLMVFPSDTIIKAVGAAGYVASLVAIFAFAAWLVAILLGLHNPLERRHPTRAGVVALWMVSLVSYALMSLTERTPSELLGAERWLMQVAGITGVAFVAAECLGSLQDIKRVLRALVWGGAFSGLVASLQFWLNVDLSTYLRMIPGFTLNADNVAISSRGALNRVAGTAIHPIELGVVTGMLLPLALYLAMHDPARRPWKRWLPVLLIATAVPASVSRSGTIAALLALGLFAVMLPARNRVMAIAAAPLAALGVFMTAPGLISTLSRFFVAGKSDASISHRTNNYPFVEQMVRQAPWFGHGGGTFQPSLSSFVNGLHILDNQYLHTVIELGLVGMCVLAYYFLLPLATALVAHRRSKDPELRILCAALAGSAAAAAVCSLTFDSLSFPMFSGVASLVVGLAGACWLLAASERRPALQAGQRAAVSGQGAPRPRLLRSPFPESGW